MKILIALLLLSSKIYASGCMHYDDFLTIQKVFPKKMVESSEYRILGYGKNHYTIILKERPENPITLVRVSDTAQRERTLAIDDIQFEEGNGCGPVYECVSGRITLTIPPSRFGGRQVAGVFVWPVLEEYTTRYDRFGGWSVDTILKPFDEKPLSGSNKVLCRYGNW